MAGNIKYVLYYSHRVLTYDNQLQIDLNNFTAKIPLQKRFSRSRNSCFILLFGGWSRGRGCRQFNNLKQCCVGLGAGAGAGGADSSIT